MSGLRFGAISVCKYMRNEQDLWVYGVGLLDGGPFYHWRPNVYARKKARQMFRHG